MHIGEKIKSRVYELGMSRLQFAKRINKSRNVVYDIFKRESIDTKLLTQISQVLDYNFFHYYYESLSELSYPKEQALSRAADTDLEYRLKEVSQQLEQVKENNDLLKRLNSVLESQVAKGGG